MRSRVKPFSGMNELKGPMGITRGVYRHGDDWVKISNELANTNLSEFHRPFETELEAKAHAAFYRTLRSEGFYHPRTRFMPGFDRQGRPTVIALMPNLSPTRQRPRVPSMVAVARALGLKPTDLYPHEDVNKDYNYGADKSGKAYYLDLHVLHSFPSPVVLNWYKSRRMHS